MSNGMSYEEAKSYSGYLEKKSRNVLGSWQKRFFQIIDGKTLIYKGKEKDKEIKGEVNLADVGYPEEVEKKVFRLKGDREFLLKTKHKDEKVKWMLAIKIVKDKLKEMGIQGTKLNSLSNMITYNEDSNVPETTNYSLPTSGTVMNKGEDSPNEDETSSLPNTFAHSALNNNADNYNEENLNANANLDININSNMNINMNANTGLNSNQYNESNNYYNTDIQNNKIESQINTNLETDNNLNNINSMQINENIGKESGFSVNQNLYSNPGVEATIKVDSGENNQQGITSGNANYNADGNINVNVGFDINAGLENKLNVEKVENTLPTFQTDININKNIEINKKEETNPEENKQININLNIKPNESIENTATNKETEESSSAFLKSKGIDKLIDLTQPKINTRFYHNFISIKNSDTDQFQKKWFILLSPRPLFDKYYMEDDTDLDPKIQKDWLKFDTIYYFRCESNDDSSKNYETINLADCVNMEKDYKFYLNLEFKEKTYEIYCERREDRDIFYEIFNNSRRTAKEYQASITKRPRNIELINSFFIRGENDFNQKIEKEKNEILGDPNKIGNDFETKLQKLAKLIESTLDGCNANSPPKLDLLKLYALYMNDEFFKVLKTFWDKTYKEVNIYEILNYSMILFDLWEGLYLQNVDDPNFYKNGKALTKIYIKKTYKNILSVIENILMEEREKKALKDKDGKYYTKGPNDLFELLTITFDSIKDYRNVYLYRSVLNLFYYLIRQYLLGVATVLTNYEIIIDKEFLLSMANNCIILEKLIKSLLEEVKKTNVLSEEEINLYFNLDKVKALINGISEKSITSLIFFFIEEVGKYFKNVFFLSLDMPKIIKISNEKMAPFIKSNYVFVSKKACKEMLKLVIYHYIYLLLETKAQDTTIDQIKEKIKKDIDILTKTYNGVIGSNLAIKILYDLLDFFNSNLNTISSSCFLLKQYIGSSFNLEALQNLINLRTDFNEQEKNEAIEKCKVVLDKNEENKNPNLSYFNIIEREKKHELEENINFEEDIFDWEDFKYDIEEENPGNQEASGIIYEGYMDQKIINGYVTKYFKLQDEFLLCYKDKNNSKILNKISVKNMIKTENNNNKDKQFTIIVNIDSDDKIGEKNQNNFKRTIYKFSCKTNDERNRWIDAIEKEIKKLRNEGNNINYNNKLEISAKKKVIMDHEKLPDVSKDYNYMREKVLEYMIKEKFFKFSPKGLENISKRNAKNGKAEEDIFGFDKIKNWFSSIFN